MKKIIIIGAGISGLSAGIFGRELGFDTEIYEMHSIAGGECTGWSRNGYHFDNCIHWLTGTNRETDLYRVWEHLGALENTEVYNFDYLYSVNSGRKILYLYKDVDKLREHLLEISPEDNEEIFKFIDIVKKLQRCNIPTKKPMDMMNIVDYIKISKSYGGAAKYISELSKMSLEEYARNFKNEIIRKAISESCPSGYSAMALFFTLGAFTSGNGGWPKGGSVSMASRIECKYKTLGGKVKYNSKVKKIIIENGEAKGIEIEGGEIIHGDYVISAVDANVLMNKLLENNYKDKVFNMQFNNPEKYPIHSSVDIGLGVKCDLFKRDHSASFDVEPFKCGIHMIDKIGIKHYCHEEHFSPKGCSTIRVNIMCNDYEYWKKLRDTNENQYYIEKDSIAKDVIKRIEKIYPETQNNFEVYDVNTPVTYERYCGAYKGAWMAFDLTTKGKSIRHGGKIKGINNFYVAGQWVMMPGGLPAACLAGKWAMQRVCKDEKIKFTFRY